LEEIVSNRTVETEETSIKFSNLSPEELTEWREGRAGELLRYELSFWSDLAKWCMWLQEDGEKYEIEIEKSVDLPKEISIHFDDLEIWFYVSDAHWPLIIPALSTVKSPLPVHDLKMGAIEKIHYDEKERALKVVGKKGDETPLLKEETEGIPVGDWLYVKATGFHRLSSDPLFQEGEIGENEIGSTLTRSASEMQEFLDVPIRLDPIPPRYFLHFDDALRLHIQLYCFEVGDLLAEGAASFFPWVYLPKHGFLKLQEVMFEEREKIVPRDEVAEFVSRHRHFLHQIPGFQTHFGSLEAHLTFRFTDEGDLSFGAEIDFPEQFYEALDFDEWVYLKGQGFYMKKENRGRLPLYPGLIVPQDNIGAFLRSHKDDLEQVQVFFAARSPIEKVGLAIRVNDEGRIEIEPKLEYAAGIDPLKVHFYGDFAYTEGEGFSELPPASRLPERYRESVLVPLNGEAAFLAYELEPLKPSIIELDPRLVRPDNLHLSIRKITRDKRKRFAEWLVDASYTSTAGTVDIFSIWDACQAKESHLFSAAGLLYLKEARFNWIRQLTKRRLDRRRGWIRMNTLEWIRLSVFEEIRPPMGMEQEDIETRAFLKELTHFESHRIPCNLSLLQSTLRPYQELGVQWLWFLYCHGLSGLLCDDMGLGKTHQAMALLAAARAEDRERGHKYLVVCPTSVIYHWQELLRKFLPDLRICTYHGLLRSLENFDTDYDLLLTSYGILRTGRENLRSFSFEVAIFDEIQIAKNYASQTYQALRKLPVRMRLGLSGTPIENRLRELKSLFDLVLPGYLPSDVIFREQFTNPIEKHQDMEKKVLLSKLIKPFILRRKKSEVLTDLPEKIEEISYCDLSSEQWELYRNIARQMRDTVCQELRDENKPVPYVHVFSALSTMKQICDHPALYLGDPKNYAEHSSGKWDLFLELLNEARGSGQKVVVFSQYLDMLAIIETYLRKKGIGFASIKGSTRDRSGELRRFREDPACEVFVASLLAAGIGIDLTVASVVIHYDRWWNPAKENQATDRVHRIGQNRGVQVFKLVAKHTIEEHIHALIERKKGLLESIIGQDEADRINYLSREELLAIFEHLSDS
jgi:superfamily II DNA or RNA helicase